MIEDSPSSLYSQCASLFYFCVPVLDFYLMERFRCIKFIESDHVILLV